VHVKDGSAGGVSASVEGDPASAEVLQGVFVDGGVE
jgi:hypothetical protein